MDWQDFFTGFALFLVFEGLAPFANPQALRRTISMISQLNDGQLRFIGLTAISAGLIMLYIVRVL